MSSPRMVPTTHNPPWCCWRKNVVVKHARCFFYRAKANLTMNVQDCWIKRLPVAKKNSISNVYSTTFLCWWERPCLIYCHFQVPGTNFLTHFALLNSLLKRAKNGFLPVNITEQVWMDHSCFCGLSTILCCSMQKFWWPLWEKKSFQK